MTLEGGDVRYYTTNEAGEIDRLILDNVTGDLWTYGVLDDVRNLTDAAAAAIDGTSGGDSSASSGSSLSALADSILPSTSEILYGIIDGSILSTFWESLTSSPSSIASWLLGAAADNTSGAVSSVLAGWVRARATSAASTGKTPPSTHRSSTRWWPAASRWAKTLRAK